jgi:hypothetical protein
MNSTGNHAIAEKLLKLGILIFYVVCTFLFRKRDNSKDSHLLLNNAMFGRKRVSESIIVV